MERRQPLRRGKALQTRSTLARGKRLNPQSAKTRNLRDEHRAIREQVFARDGWVCQVRLRVEGAGRCFGVLTPHHVVKAGQGGTYTMDNLVSCCAHHNEAMESDADLAAAARAAGLVRRRGDS